MVRGRGKTRRTGALLAIALVALGLAGGVARAGSAPETGDTGFSFAGESRALRLAIGDHRTVFGLALSRANLLPEAIGVGAGQCKMTRIDKIGETGNVPCSDETTQVSASPADGKTETRQSCSGSVSKPLREIISIRTACGRSTSGLTEDLPFTESSAKVPVLRAMLGLQDVLPVDARATKAEIDQVSEYLTEVFASELGVVGRKGISTLEKGVGNLVTGYLEVGKKLSRADLISVRLGHSSSSITPEGSTFTVASATAGARIGLLPLPRTVRNGEPILGDPLRKGLLIIDVGAASASAQVDRTSAASTSSALAGSVTVHLRDLSKAKPRYVDVAVAEGESVTLLEGTPWQSTITAGSAVSEKNLGSAEASAEPVHLALLSGMSGGVTLDLGGARATADLTAVPTAVGRQIAVPRRPLPATGGVKPVLVPLVLGLVALAAGVLSWRGRSSSNRARFIDPLKPSVTARRRAYRSLAALLAFSGIGLFSYPLVTDVWAARIQGSIAADFSRSAASYVTKQIEVGEPLTRIEIPSLGVDTLVVEGITPKALEAGAGHYPMTPLPGEPGNVAIAGHRTSFGSPFARMDELLPGDDIILTTPVGRHSYKVVGRPSVADPDDWSIITDHPPGGSYLTLTSCHPEGSEEYRIWVRAELVTSGDAEEVS